MITFVALSSVDSNVLSILVALLIELDLSAPCCLDFKAAHRNKALSYAYEKFVQSKKRDRVLKLLKEQVD